MSEEDQGNLSTGLSLEPTVLTPKHSWTPGTFPPPEGLAEVTGVRCKHMVNTFKFTKAGDRNVFIINLAVFQFFSGILENDNGALATKQRDRPHLPSMRQHIYYLWWTN